MHLALALLIDTQRAAPSATHSVAGAGPELGWMATVVAILLVLILAVAYGVRRVVGGAWRARAARRSLSVLDVLPLGGRRQVVVVRCYDRTFALGLGDKEVSLVAELDTEFVAAQAAPKEGASSAPATPARAFAALIDRASQRLVRQRDGATGSAGAAVVDFVVDDPVPVPAPRPTRARAKPARAIASVEAALEREVVV